MSDDFDRIVLPALILITRQRADVPPSIASAGDGSLDMSTWGPPTAAYPAGGCDMAGFFAPQQLVLDITLCGNW